MQDLCTERLLYTTLEPSKNGAYARESGGGVPCLIYLQIMLSIPSKFVTKTPPSASFLSLSASEKEVRMAGGDDGGVPPPICLQIMLQMPLVHQLFANPAAFSRTYLPPQSTHHLLFLQSFSSG